MSVVANATGLLSSWGQKCQHHNDDTATVVTTHSADTVKRSNVHTNAKYKTMEPIKPTSKTSRCPYATLQDFVRAHPQLVQACQDDIGSLLGPVRRTVAGVATMTDEEIVAQLTDLLRSRQLPRQETNEREGEEAASVPAAADFTGNHYPYATLQQFVMARPQVLINYFLLKDVRDLVAGAATMTDEQITAQFNDLLRSQLPRQETNVPTRVGVIERNSSTEFSDLTGNEQPAQNQDCSKPNQGGSAGMLQEQTGGTSARDALPAPSGSSRSLNRDAAATSQSDIFAAFARTIEPCTNTVITSNPIPVQFNSSAVCVPEGSTSSGGGAASNEATTTIGKPSASAAAPVPADVSESNVPGRCAGTNSNPDPVLNEANSRTGNDSDDLASLEDKKPAAKKQKTMPR